MPLLLLSKSNPFRWASIWFWFELGNCGIYTVAMFHVGASYVLLVPILYIKRSSGAIGNFCSALYHPVFLWYSWAVKQWESDRTASGGERICWNIRT